MGSSVLVCAVLPAVPPLCLMNSELSSREEAGREWQVQFHKYGQGMRQSLRFLLIQTILWLKVKTEQEALPSTCRRCSVVKLSLDSCVYLLLKWFSHSSLSDMDLQTRHMALSSLFTETLMMMNNSSVTTAESLRGSLRKWIDSKVHGLLAMPLLTAACQSLASVRHMAETTEACITAYFNEGGSLSAAAACLKTFHQTWMTFHTNCLEPLQLHTAQYWNWVLIWFRSELLSLLASSCHTDTWCRS